tara:strand:- start:5623 stop:6270 length:648 start_codon:yes stop_codon:yes gene_type:complete
MKASEIVESIKEVLGMELSEVKVELEERKLENGTRIEAESFEKGKSVFILTDDEKVAMPVGEYLFEDGTLLVVEEEGVIADVREDVDDEVPQKEEAGEEKEEMKEKEEEDKYDEEADVADWKGMEKRIKNLEDAIADLKSDKENKNSKEVEASEEVKEEEVVEEKVEASKVELNEVEAAEPISHNPEKVEKKERVHLAKNRAKSTLDRVLEKINQ